jgi:hypothetical protein
MESILPILIGVAFILLQIAAAGKKKKESAQRPTPSPPPAAAALPQEDLWKQWMSILNPEPEEPEDDPETAGIEAGLYPQYCPTEESPVVPVKSAPPQAPATPADDTLPLSEEAAFAEATPQPAHWLNAATFDLKKAVVYSEIMRPKFED